MCHPPVGIYIGLIWVTHRPDQHFLCAFMHKATSYPPFPIPYLSRGSDVHATSYHADSRNVVQVVWGAMYRHAAENDSKHRNETNPNFIPAHYHLEATPKHNGNTILLEQ